MQCDRLMLMVRSEERRVGKECRSRWERYIQYKKIGAESRRIKLEITTNRTLHPSTTYMDVFFTSRRRHTISVSAFLLNRSSDLIKDECSRLLEASTMKSRRGFAIQRLMNAMRQAHADGWFIVFDTLTLADDRLEAFYDNPNALRDYFRDIGRMVLAAEGRKA